MGRKPNTPEEIESYKVVRENVRDLLAEVERDHGWSLNKFCEENRIAESGLRAFIKEKSATVAMTTLEKIAKVRGLPPTELFKPGIFSQRPLPVRITGVQRTLLAPLPEGGTELQLWVQGAPRYVADLDRDNLSMLVLGARIMLGEVKLEGADSSPVVKK